METLARPQRRPTLPPRRTVLPWLSSCIFWRRLREGSRWASSSRLPSNAALWQAQRGKEAQEGR